MKCLCLSDSGKCIPVAEAAECVKDIDTSQTHYAGI